MVLCRDIAAWKALRVATMKEYGNGSGRDASIGERSAGASWRASRVIDQHVLASRLSALEGYRAKLASFRRFSREEFLADEDVHQLAAPLAEGSTWMTSWQTQTTSSSPLNSEGTLHSLRTATVPGRSRIHPAEPAECRKTFPRSSRHEAPDTS